MFHRFVGTLAERERGKSTEQILIWVKIKLLTRLGPRSKLPSADQNKF